MLSKPKIRLDELESWQLVKSAKKEFNFDRKTDALQRCHMDEDKLIAAGKLASASDVKILSTKIERYLTNQPAHDDHKILKDESFAFQVHLITFLVFVQLRQFVLVTLAPRS